MKESPLHTLWETPFERCLFVVNVFLLLIVLVINLLNYHSPVFVEHVWF